MTYRELLHVVGLVLVLRARRERRDELGGKPLGQILEHCHCGLPDRFVGADLRRGCERCASLLGIAELAMDEPQCQPNSLMCRIRCHAVIEPAECFSRSTEIVQCEPQFVLDIYVVRVKRQQPFIQVRCSIVLLLGEKLISSPT